MRGPKLYPRGTHLADVPPDFRGIPFEALRTLDLFGDRPASTPSAPAPKPRVRPTAQGVLPHTRRFEYV